MHIYILYIYTHIYYIKGMKKNPNRRVSPNRSFFLKHVKKSRIYYVIDFQAKLDNLKVFK